MRRLPCTTLPTPGESFDSWLHRSAVDLDLPLGVLARFLGLEERTPRWGACRPIFYGVVMTDLTRKNISIATELDPGRLEALQMSAYSPVAFNTTQLDRGDLGTLRATAASQWALFRHSRACPACLGEDEAWPLWWRLGLAAVCGRHSLVLADSCPACHQNLRSRVGGENGRLSLSTLSATSVCGNPLGQSTCSHPMVDLARVPASEAAMAGQRLLIDALTSPQASVAGRTVSSSDLHGTARQLAYMLRLSWTEASAAAMPGVEGDATRTFIALRDNEGTRAWPSFGRCPQSAAEAAALVAGIGNVLLASPSTLGERVDDLVGAVHAQRRGSRDPLTRLAAPLCVAAEWRDSVLARRGRRVSAILGRPSVSVESVTGRYLPQLVDAGAWARVERFLPGTAAMTGRRFVALAVARVCGAASWPAAARTLELPARESASMADVVGRRLIDWVAFWAVVETIAAELVSARLDYGLRRATLAEWRDMPPAAWTQIARSHHFVATTNRRRCAVTWAWASVCGSDWRSAPALQADARNQETSRELYRRFLSQVPEELLRDLRIWTLDAFNLKERR